MHEPVTLLTWAECVARRSSKWRRASQGCTRWRSKARRTTARRRSRSRSSTRYEEQISSTSTSTTRVLCLCLCALALFTSDCTCWHTWATPRSVLWADPSRDRANSSQRSGLRDHRPQDSSVRFIHLILAINNIITRTGVHNSPAHSCQVFEYVYVLFWF